MNKIRLQLINSILDYLERTVQPIDVANLKFKHFEVDNGNIEFGRADTAVFFYDNVTKKYYYMDQDRDYSKQQFDTINDAIRGAIADLAQGSNLDTLVDLDMFMNEVTTEHLDYWDGNKTPYFSQHPLFNKGWPGYALGQLRMRIYYE